MKLPGLLHDAKVFANFTIYNKVQSGVQSGKVQSLEILPTLRLKDRLRVQTFVDLKFEIVHVVVYSCFVLQKYFE